MGSPADFVASPGPMVVLRVLPYQAPLRMRSRHCLILELNILQELRWNRSDLFVDREVREIDEVKVAINGWRIILTA